RRGRRRGEPTCSRAAPSSSISRREADGGRHLARSRSHADAARISAPFWIGEPGRNVLQQAIAYSTHDGGPRAVSEPTATRHAILHYHIFKNAGMSVDAALREAFAGEWATLDG